MIEDNQSPKLEIIVTIINKTIFITLKRFAFIGFISRHNYIIQRKIEKGFWEIVGVREIEREAGR